MMANMDESTPLMHSPPPPPPNGNGEQEQHEHQQQHESVNSSVASLDFGKLSQSHSEDSSNNNEEDNIGNLPNYQNRIHHRRKHSRKSTLFAASSSVYKTHGALDFETIINTYSVNATKVQLFGPNYLKKKKQQEEDESPHSKRSGRTLTRWILACLTGLFTGLITILIVTCTEYLVYWRGYRLNRMGEMVEYAKQDYNMHHDTTNTNTTNDDDHDFNLVDVVRESMVSWNVAFKVFGEYVLWNLFLALSSSLMCLILAPRAVGSGIPETIAYLNGVRVERFTSFSLFLVKVVGTILSVSSGLAIGPEGPLVHLGAIMGASLTKMARWERHVWSMRRRCPLLSGCLGCAETGVVMDEDEDGDKEGGEDGGEGRRQRKKKNWRHSWWCCLCNNSIISKIMEQLSPLRNDAERRDLISIGAACGFAAAFGAPIGGLLFSMEEASTFFEHPMLFKTIVATAISSFCLTIYRGDLSAYGVITISSVDSPDNNPFVDRFEEVPVYALVGVFGGLLGAFFNSSWEHMSLLRRGFFERKKISKTGRNIEKLAEVGLLSLITSILTFALAMLLRAWTCKDRASEVAINMLKVDDESDLSEFRFGCGRGQVDELGVILFGSRENAIKYILLDPTMFHPVTLLSVGFLFFPLMTLTFGVNIPSGIFMPTMLVGASLGGVGSIAFNSLFDMELAPSTFALLGAAALLSGIQRSTVSLCVILVEGTGQTKVLIPVIITVVMARYVGDFFNHGIYEVAIEVKEYPVLDHHIKKAYTIYKVKDIMSSPVITIHSVETARNIEVILRQSSHHGFPVVDVDTRKYLGLVRRDQLVALLECGIFMENSTTLMRDLFRKSFKDESMLALDIRDDRYHKFPSFTSSAVGSSTSIRKSLEEPSWDTILDDEFDEHAWLRDNIHIGSDDNITLIGGDIALPKISVNRRTETTVFADRGKLVVHLDESHYSKHVDVSAVMNQGAYCVTEGMPLSKAYKMFTALGLRHLVVLGGKDGGEVVGILSRTNFLPDYIELCTEDKHLEN